MKYFVRFYSDTVYLDFISNRETSALCSHHRRRFTFGGGLSTKQPKVDGLNLGILDVP